MTPTIEACWDWAYKREDMNAPFDFFVYEDAHEKARELISPLEYYFLDSKMFTNVFYNAYLHYCITTDYRLEYEKVFPERPSATITPINTPSASIPMTDLTDSTQSVPMTDLTDSTQSVPMTDSTQSVPMTDMTDAAVVSPVSSSSNDEYLNKWLPLTGDVVQDAINAFDALNNGTLLPEEALTNTSALYSSVAARFNNVTTDDVNNITDKNKKDEFLSAARQIHFMFASIDDTTWQSIGGIGSVPQTKDFDSLNTASPGDSASNSGNSGSSNNSSSSNNSIPIINQTDSQRWVINTMYKKYDIENNSVIYNSVSDGSSSTSAQMFSSLNDGDFLMADLIRTPYGLYVYRTLEQMNCWAVLL